MLNSRKSGQILRSKKRPRPTLRSGRGSRTNFHTSHQVRGRVIEGGQRPRRMGAGPEIGPSDPTGRSCGRDHSSFNWFRGDRNITFAVCQPWCGRKLTRGASNMTEALARTPCRGGIPPLTREQAELFHAQAPDWQLAEEAHRIERSFRFRNFRGALTFVQEIGELAEAEGHHPNISFG